MRLIPSKKQRELWEMIKPYLRTNGTKVTLDDNAPNSVKEAYAEHTCIANEAEKKAIASLL